jgi:hypothetical protein
VPYEQEAEDDEWDWHPDKETMKYSFFSKPQTKRTDMRAASCIFWSIVVSTILASSASAFPSGRIPAAPTSEELLKVRLTKSNACKLKYKHRKAAQDLREKAHCN